MDNGQARMRDLRVVYVSYLPAPPFSLFLSLSLPPLLCSSCCSFNNSKCRCFFTLLVPACLHACLPASLHIAQHAHTLRIRNGLTLRIRNKANSTQQLVAVVESGFCQRCKTFACLLSVSSLRLSLSLSRTPISTLSLYVSQLFNNFVASAAHVVVATKPFKLLENALTT